jgi:hypothetical protein
VWSSRSRRPAPVQVAGWGSLPSSVVARAAVPDPLARPIWTNPSVGCPASGGGPGFHPGRHTGVHDRRSPGRRARMWACGPWSCRSCEGRRQVLELISRRLSDGNCAPEEPDHEQSRRHPAATVSSRTVVPLSRGRPSEHPQNSVVNPTQPPARVRGRGEQGERTEGPGSGAMLSGPSRGRRVNATFHGHVDTMGVGAQRRPITST